MRRIIFWMIGAVLLLTLAACATQRTAPEPGTVRFGLAAEPYPPFTMQDQSGKWVGFEVDLMDAVCAEMKSKCTIVAVPWDSIIQSLRDGKFDVIWASMSVTADRAKFIDFSDPYYNTHAVIVAAKSADIDPANPATLRGKRIAVYRSTLQEAYARKNFQDAQIQSMDTFDEMEGALRSGSADALFEDQTMAEPFLKSADGASYAVKWTAPHDPSFGSGVAAGLRKSDSELKGRLNSALRAVRESGQFKAIAARYFTLDMSPE